MEGSPLQTTLFESRSLSCPTLLGGPWRSCSLIIGHDEPIPWSSLIPGINLADCRTMEELARVSGRDWKPKRWVLQTEGEKKRDNFEEDPDIEWNQV